MLVPDVRLTVVGIGADGWAGLAEAVRSAICDAEVILGAPRQLGLLPEVGSQQRVLWPSPLRAGVPALLAAHSDRRLVALASGDPMVSGIGSMLIDLLGGGPGHRGSARVLGRVGPRADGLVGGVDRRGQRRRTRRAHGAAGVGAGSSGPGASADEQTPAEVADLLAARGYGSSRMVVLGDLGSHSETRLETTAAEFADVVSRLNVVAVELVGPLGTGWATGLPDDMFEDDGQLTKRDLRAAALARLMPAPGQLLWDVGAGAGSVGIEWMRAHPTCRAVAVEADGVRADRIGRNARTLGVPGLEIVHGSAPEALDGLPAPDAVFIGGGGTRAGVLDACLPALRPDGRLVVHGVTVETEVLLGQAYRERGGELTRIHIERAAPVGSFTGWTPARAVTQWAFTRL
jgi:precorrin-6B C5,15-methyltransferase / cobalt-precorrin-6B C5,C15-methyltransferase